MDNDLITIIASVGTNLATIIGCIIAIIKAIRQATGEKEKQLKTSQAQVEELKEMLISQEKQIGILTANLEREQRKRLHIKDKRDEEI